MNKKFYIVIEESSEDDWYFDNKITGYNILNVCANKDTANLCKTEREKRIRILLQNYISIY